MGLKNFMNNMIEKQKESNDKIREILNEAKEKDEIRKDKYNKRMALIQEKQQIFKTTKKVENDNLVHCSKCGSTSVSADKKGFSLGKALVGSAVVLPLGAVTGMIGKNKIHITCLNCGHKWKPGEK